MHEFTREALAEAGAAHVVPPFSVVASNTMDLSVGRSVSLLTPHCLLSCQPMLLLTLGDAMCCLRETSGEISLISLQKTLRDLQALWLLQEEECSSAKEHRSCIRK